MSIYGKILVYGLCLPATGAGIVAATLWITHSWLASTPRFHKTDRLPVKVVKTTVEPAHPLAIKPEPTTAPAVIASPAVKVEPPPPKKKDTKRKRRVRVRYD